QRMHYDGKLSGQVIADEDILFILDRNKELSKAHKKELDDSVENQKQAILGDQYKKPASYQPPVAAADEKSAAPAGQLVVAAGSADAKADTKSDAQGDAKDGAVTFTAAPAAAIHSPVKAARL